MLRWFLATGQLKRPNSVSSLIAKALQELTPVKWVVDADVINIIITKT